MILFLCSVTTYKTSKVKDRIKECKIVLSVIPRGLTWRLQPLDISISNVFKESLIIKYAYYWIGKNNIQASKSVIIESINELWHLDFVIPIKLYLIPLNIQELVTN